MNKEQLLNSFKDSIDRNFVERQGYFDFTLEIFSEFNTLFYEINKCLILELDRAAITLTNHLVEQLLKFALIKNYTGIDHIPYEKWNDIFSKANEKFGSISFGNAIELCKKQGLIEEKEKAILFDRIREIIRNGFSHSDFSRILSDLSDDDIDLFNTTIDNSSEIKKIDVKHKLIPIFQAINAENFAKGIAKIYFDFIYNLTFKIEKRLIEKHL